MFKIIEDHKSELNQDDTAFHKSSDLARNRTLFLQRYRKRNIEIDLFVCVEVLRPSQPNGVMSSAVSLPNHTFTGQA